MRNGEVQAENSGCRTEGWEHSGNGPRGLQKTSTETLSLFPLGASKLSIQGPDAGHAQEPDRTNLDPESRGLSRTGRKCGPVEL